MKEIRLSRGYLAIVDDDMFGVLSSQPWYPSPMTRGRGKVYAVGSSEINGRRSTVYMHRIVIGALPGQIVDHIDGNPLNNQRSNLRFASATLNTVNSRKQPGRSGFRGVYLHHARYVAEAGFEGRRYRRVGFDDPADAARAYDEMAKHLFGDFAQLNFPAAS